MTENSKGNQLMAKNTILLCIRMVIVLGITLYTSRVVLRVLGVEDYGIYNVVGGFVVMFGFLNGALSTGVQRFYNFEYGKNGIEGANRVFVTAVQTQTIIAIVTILLVETIGLWYINNKMVIPPGRLNAAFWIFQFSTVSLGTTILTVPYQAAILAHEKMDFYAIIGIMDQLLKLGIALLLPYTTSDKLITYGALFLVITAINFACNILYTKIKFEEIEYHFVFHKSLFMELLQFSGWNIFGKLALMGKDQGLNMILNLFFGPVVNAARGVANQVYGAISGFVSNIPVAVKPQLTQAYAQGNIKRTFSLMFAISKACFFFTFLMALPICLEIDFILNLWLGANHVPEYTNIFVVLIIMISLVGNLNSPVSFVVHATGKMRRYQVVTSIIEILVLPSSYIALKLSANPPVVFIVSLMFTVIGQIVSLFILRGLVTFSLRKYFKEVIMPLATASIIACVIPILIRCSLDEGFIRVALIFVLSVLCALSSAYVFGLTKIEKQMCVKLLRSASARFSVKRR